MAANKRIIGGHVAWHHDEGHDAGAFVTFDHLPLPGLPPRKVHVLVPRNLTGRVPLVVMHDGNTAFWPGGIAGSTWDAARAVARARRDVVVVAVHSPDRNAEYTHVDWSGGRRSFGLLPRYAHAIARGLVPFIDAHFPTIPQRAARAVVGSSHGGLASFFIATRYPDVFGFGGCMSPSLFSGIEPYPYGGGSVPLNAASIVKDVWGVLEDASQRPRLWLCWGLRRDGGEHNSVVEHLATKRGREAVPLLVARGYRAHHMRGHDDIAPRDADLIVMEDARGGHDEASWGARLTTLLRTLPDGR